MSRSYVIIDASEVSSVVFDQVLETSADTLRYNVAGTQTFVKYEGNKPRFLYGKTAYTHSEILNILSGSDWTDPNGP
tara:strand:+ start:550 stop:780 length:231 start_codon:yes stop_codon:yes gene_type:complete